MFIRPRIVFILFALICTVPTYAQLRLSFVDDPPLDGSRYPLYSARVKATLNGVPFVLNTANVLVEEDVVISRPFSVSAPQANIQTVQWYSRTRNLKGGTATIVVFDKNLTASVSADTASGLGPESRIPQVRVTDVRDKPLRETSFGNVPLGTSATQNYFCVPTSGRLLPDGGDDRVIVDSIRTSSDCFVLTWRGGPGAWSLPGKLSSPLDYGFGITFTPKEDRYYREILTIYYEGGAIEEIVLTANIFVLPMRTILNITRPNGSEILAPCTQQTVTWTGAALGSTTIVEYSIDAGRNWIEIARTKDSSLVWDIPDTPSDNVQLRVRTESENQLETNLHDSNNSAGDFVSFSPDSKSIVACYRNGEVYEWDVTQLLVSKKHFLRADLALNAGNTVFGAGYSSNSTFFVAYRSSNKKSQSDTLALYNSSTGAPQTVVALDTASRYKAAYIDSTRSTIIFLPLLGTTIRVHSTVDGSFMRDVTLPTPITALSIGKDKAVVALMDGRLQVFALPSWTLQQSIGLSAIPYIEQVLLMPDNARIAIGCRSTTTMLNEGAFSQSDLVDMGSAQVIRSQLRNNSTPICVSANTTSRYVLFGYTGQPQAPLWDTPPNQQYATIVAHAGALTNLSFSPSGTLLASSANAADNLHLREFIYPEIDYTDGPIRIVRQSLASLKATFVPTYAFTGRDSTFTVNLCNNGLVPVVISSKAFTSGTHFRLSAATSHDTIFPGGCLTIPVSFMPLDTGLLSDVFQVKACNATFKLPVEAYAIPRNLSVPDTVDFGDVCPSTELVKDINIIRNNDPASLVLNSSLITNQANTWFSLNTVTNNDTLAAGGTYTMKVRFAPTGVGIQTKDLVIYYGNQRRIFAHIVLRGRGAGSQIQAQPQVVSFIPEEPSRTVVIRNGNDNPVIMNALTIDPPGAYVLDPVQLPYTIAPHDSLVLRVMWSDTTSNVQASIAATLAPCGVPVKIALRRYSGSALLSIPVVQADPKGDAIIPIQLRLAENYSYGAERTLNAEFTVNPRMFLPQSISSWLGEAKITRNEIVNDKRIIGFSLRADFPFKDTIIAMMHGPAGLAETDSSPLQFNTQSAFFGRSVQTTTKDGELKLINLCGDRRVIQSSTLAIIGIDPNPVSANASLSIVSAESGEVLCDVYSSRAEKVLSTRFQVQSGLSTQQLNVSELLSGSYTVLMQMGGVRTTAVIVVTR